ncbi:MAG: DUF4266 domain-containing protein [Cellvibrionaceae bacterium]
MNNLKIIIVLLVTQFLFSCSYVGAWEKGNLSRPEMMFTPDPLEQRLRDHVYFSKEASSSGSAVSGGGCGCN